MGRGRAQGTSGPRYEQPEAPNGTSTLLGAGASLLVAKSPDPYVIFTPVRDATGAVVDFTYAEANEAACDHEYLRREDLIGARLLDLHPAVADEGILERYVAVVESGQPFDVSDVPYPMESRGGELRYHDVRAIPIGDAICQTWTDVTERNRAIAELAASEANYRLIAENATDVVFRGSNDGVVEWISDSVASLLDWRPDHVIGRPIVEFVHEESLQTLATIQSRLSEGLDAQGELRVRRGAGGYRWMSASLKVLRDENGAVIGRAGGWKDITDEVAARRDLALLAAGNRVVLRATNEEELLTQMCQTAAEVGGYIFAWYGIPLDDEEKTVLPVAVGGDDRGYLETLQVRWDEGPLGQGPTGRSIRTRTTVTSNDHAHDSRFSPWRKAAGQRGIHCSIGLPVVVDGEIHGSLMAYSDHSGAFDAQAIELLESLAANIGYGISRLRAEAAFAESQYRFRLMAENATDIVFHQVEGIVEWVSPSVTSVTGWQPEELIGHTTEHLWHPEDHDAAVALRDATYQGRSGTGVFRWRRPDDSYVWLEAALQPLTDPDGRVGTVGILRDVTERQEATAALAASETQYRLIAENASDVVLRSELTGIISWVSPSVTEVLGWAPDDLIGRNQVDLVHPDDLAAARARQDQALAHGKSQGDLEIRYQTKSGEWRWVRGHGKALRDSAGQVIGGIDTLRDIDKEMATRVRLEFEVDHDSLTGLVTRSRLIERLESERATRSAEDDAADYALLCIGIDGIDVINAAFTHTAGDRVLVAVAERLIAALDSPSLVGRTADNEFSVLLTEPPDETELLDFADHLQSALGGPVHMGAENFAVTASIGIAIDHGGAGLEVLRDASSAMQKAQEKGGNRWEFADPTLAVEARQRLRLQSGLHEALAAGQIRPWYQPIVSLPEGRVRGYEALARWVRPDGSIVPPDQFIPVAERSDVIIELDREILRQALAAIRELPDSLHVAVNLAAATLSAPDLVESVTRALGEAAVNPRRLHLEVTETSLLQVTQTIQSGMRSLANLGLTWWVDDFGTGYSSLAHLRDMPVQGLKLDRSFTSGITAEDSTQLRVAQGLQGLAQGLGLSTVAEGVETQRQADILAAQGWDMAQGWLFGKPRPSAAAE